VIAVPAGRGVIAEATDALLSLGELPPDQAPRIAERVAQLARIRKAKCAAIARGEARLREAAASPTDLEREALATLAALPELQTLDGYERKARSRLRRALRRL